MRKIFTLALAAFMFAACAKQNDKMVNAQINDQMVNDQMVNVLSDYHAHAIPDSYRDQEAYQSHLQTPHFLDYKQGTLHMVKSLKLVDTKPLAPESMPLIFKKY